MSTATTSPDHGPEGLLRFDYDCAELNSMLTCWFEYEPAERGSEYEPAYPASFALVHAYLPGSNVDLAAVLYDGLVAEINEWVYGEAEDAAQEARDEADIDRYIDSEGY